ncbi:Helix-turn-helix domain-containing protein [Propionispira arboris]|uniref:Helix-turn-helix domain-containing protein n=1 Tax=Propionispira arboris TaxID=84035 RepID=A0A1H7DA79_9FIRM|nr:helix-turn-helix domain-containing protein [Propionispira arboris]SEJ96080.1 Helix-turn-helix domain-containing protein [Propionispira arboris]
MEEKHAKNKFLTANEVADEFFQGKLKYQRVLKMTREGELPAIKIGKAYVYLLSELQKWVDGKFRQPAWSGKEIKWID